MSGSGPSLHVEWTGRGRPVVFLHGFTQTGRSWAPILERLGPGLRAAAVDLPGHGGSTEVAASLDVAADLIAEACGPAVYVGYSLGGRHALHVALRHPEVIEGLVLLGATAGIDDEHQREERRRHDERLATRIETIGVERFLDEWLTQPLFAGLSAAAADPADRLRNRPEGLASSLRSAGTGQQIPSWDTVATIGAAGVPVLCLAGELDTKFVALGRRLAEAIGPTARFEQIPGTGHSAHLEAPDRFAELLTAFLSR